MTRAVTRTPHVYLVALAAGLVAALLVRASVAPACALLALAAARPRALALAALLVAGWWWGSERLRALDRSALAPYVDTAGEVVAHVTEPPRRGRFDVRVRATVARWRGGPLRERVLFRLPGTRAPPQGATILALATVREPAAFERVRLARQGVHVVLRASAWHVVRRRGGVADRLHAWLARASTPGLAGERRAVLRGVVLGDDDGLSDELKQRFRASGLYHLLAVSGGNVIVVAAGAVGLAGLVGIGRLGGEALALLAIGAYVLAVGPQPSVVRAGVAGALGSLAWLSGRARDRWYALLLGAVALLAWNPWNVLDPGFQLSFAAVLGIFVVMPRLRRGLDGYPVPRPAADVVAISAACGLCTAPIAWLHFHAVPLLSIPANVAAAPVVEAMLALALLAALVPPLGPLLAQLAGWCAAYFAACARFFGALPGAQARSPAAVAAIASGICLVAAYAWRRGERLEAGLPPARERPTEDLARRPPPP
ncbi:MAG TPA: ComEC/Rec2 family competence protein [Gaiellaceae bacterium]|nr:ComEC/Rec2 family competence protein [Gaiellaceae bacterium]